jgi:5'-nucleotidase/UDP-sugar diphosphatase
MVPRLVRALSLLAVALSGLVAQVAPAPAAAAKDAAADVVLLHVNDFHGQFRPLEALWRERRAGRAGEPELVGGAASLAGYVRATRTAAAANGARVVLTDAGDWYQGTLEGNAAGAGLPHGWLAVDFLSRLGLDASVIGNHEYDHGDANLRALIGRARFPVLAANALATGPVDAAAGGRPGCAYAQPLQVVDVHGCRLVIVGLITADAKNVSTGPFGDVEFEREEQALRAVLPGARAKGDVIVLLSHCGLETDKRLAAAFPEIPLILGGHSHVALKTPLVEGSTWIVHTQGKATSVYRVDARVERGGGNGPAAAPARRLALRRAELVELDLARHPEDPDTVAWIREQTRDLAATWDRVIGELVTPLLDERGTHSTAAGNLLCDALREVTGADLAFSNKGGIRTRLRPGPLTPRHLYELMPFDNTVVSMTLRGSDVRELLRGTLRPGRRLLDLSGGSYHYELVDGARELRAVTVGGAPLDDARRYRVAVSSFLANGGDSYPQLANGAERRDHGVLVRDVLIAKVERERRLVVDTTQRIVCDEPK